MMPHRPAITLSKRMNSVDLVDVIAQPVEKRIAGQSAKLGFGCHVAKDGVEAARDIRGVRKACATFCGVDAAILAGPLIDILEQMLVERPIAVGCCWKGETCHLDPAHGGKALFGLFQSRAVGDPQRVPENISAGVSVGIVR